MEQQRQESVGGVYALHGIWNLAWEKDNAFGPEATAQAKRIFENLCHAWNDSEDSRSQILPTQ
jgi:hypothetical protein